MKIFDCLKITSVQENPTLPKRPLSCLPRPDNAVYPEGALPAATPNFFSVVAEKISFLMARKRVMRERSLDHVNMDTLTEPHQFELIRLCINASNMGTYFPRLAKLTPVHRIELLAPLLDAATPLDLEGILSLCNRLDEIGKENTLSFLKRCIAKCTDLEVFLGFLTHFTRLEPSGSEKIKILQPRIRAWSGYDWIPLLIAKFKLQVDDANMGMQELIELNTKRNQSFKCCAANLGILKCISYEEVGKGPFLCFMDLFSRRLGKLYSSRETMWKEDSSKVCGYVTALVTFAYPEEIHFEVAKLFADHLPEALVTNFSLFKLSEEQRLEVAKMVPKLS